MNWFVNCLAKAAHIFGSVVGKLSSITVEIADAFVEGVSKQLK